MPEGANRGSNTPSSGSPLGRIRRWLTGPPLPEIVQPDDPRYSVIRRILREHEAVFQSRAPIDSQQIRLFRHGLAEAILRALDDEPERLRRETDEFLRRTPTEFPEEADCG